MKIHIAGFGPDSARGTSTMPSVRSGMGHSLDTSWASLVAKKPQIAGKLQVMRELLSNTSILSRRVQPTSPVL
jgi:hypothetical protein